MATTIPYGCAAEYDGPDIPALLKADHHGLYRRPAIDLRTGDVARNTDGSVQHDESTLPTRHHLTWVKKGFQLARIVR